MTGCDHDLHAHRGVLYCVREGCDYSESERRDLGVAALRRQHARLSRFVGDVVGVTVVVLVSLVTCGWIGSWRAEQWTASVDREGWERGSYTQAPDATAGKRLVFDRNQVGRRVQRCWWDTGLHALVCDLVGEIEPVIIGPQVEPTP